MPLNYVQTGFDGSGNLLFEYGLCSKILLSKQKIIDLFPKIERTLEIMKEAETTVIQMQVKRQREFWHLLKIACVSHMLLMSEGQICF